MVYYICSMRMNRIGLVFSLAVGSCLCLKLQASYPLPHPTAAVAIGTIAREDFWQTRKKTSNYSIYKNNQFLFTLTENKFRSFRDSIALRTQDTLFTRKDGRVDIHPFRKRTAAVNTEKKKTLSLVYTDKKGYVNLRLPNPRFYKYVVRFFESTGKLAFEIQAPKEDWLVLEKSNFVHAGTFEYEVWQDGNLQEKGRIFLSR